MKYELRNKVWLYELVLALTLFLALTLNLVATTQVREGTQTMGPLPVAQGGVPSGGTTNQVLSKNSNTDYDDIWKTISTTVVGYIGFTTDGAGLTILTGTKGYFTVDYTGTITGWSITADGSSPTCTIDVWKIATGTALPTVTNTITASAKPALATGNAIRSTTLTGWTTSFSAGDIFGFHVDAVTVATKITFSLETTR